MNDNVIPFAPIESYDEAPPRKPQLPDGVRIEDFRAYLPTHNYIYEPTGEMWPATSVNAKASAPDGGKANAWLDAHRSVVQMTWTPDEAQIIDGKVIHDGGWLEQPGVQVFNQYRPPKEAKGDPNDVQVWTDHVAHIYPDDHRHIIAWLAHRAQRPGEKVNHALLLGGAPGIGKDTLLDPVRHAVGPWNFQEVSPQQMLGRFNGFLKSVILRISETHDLGDMDRYSFYEHSKQYMAAPPDVLRCDEKHIREYSVVNVMGVILTTNHKTNGIYLPADDRRHYVAWSPRTKESLPTDYFEHIYAWYEEGGRNNVIAFLRSYNLASFNPKASPPKTPAFFEIVDSNRSPEDAEMADTLERMRSPDALTIPQIVVSADEHFAKWLSERKNSRLVAHRLDATNYVPVRNSTADQGLWKVDGKRQTVYAKKSLSYREQCAAAQKLTLPKSAPERW